MTNGRPPDDPDILPMLSSYSSHPEPEVLAALLEADAAADPELAAALDHSATCPVCQAELTAMRRTDALVAGWSLGAAAPPARVDTALYAALGLPIPLKSGNFAVDDSFTTETQRRTDSTIVVEEASNSDKPISLEDRRHAKTRRTAWRTATFGLARVAALVFAVGLIVAIALNLTTSTTNTVSTGTSANAPAATTAPAAVFAVLSPTPTGENFQIPGSSGGSTLNVTTAPVGDAPQPAVGSATTAPAASATTVPAASATTAPAMSATTAPASAQNGTFDTSARTSQLAYTDSAANNTRDLKIVDFDANGKIIGRPKTVVANVTGGVWSPDSLHLAYVQDKKLYVLDPDQATGTNIVAATLIATSDNTNLPVVIAWSPDSHALLYGYISDGATTTPKLYVSDVYGQNRIEVGEFYPFDARWTPNGRTVIYEKDKEVFGVDINIGTTISVGTPRRLFGTEKSFTLLGVSPDSRLLAYYTTDANSGATGSKSVAIVPVAGGEPLALPRIYSGFGNNPRWHDFNGRIFFDGYELTQDGKLARADSLWPKETAEAWSGDLVLLTNAQTNGVKPSGRVVRLTATGLQEVVATKNVLAGYPVVADEAGHFLYVGDVNGAVDLYIASAAGTLRVPGFGNAGEFTKDSTEYPRIAFAPQRNSRAFSAWVKGVNYVGNIAADDKSAAVTPLTQVISGSTDPQTVGWRP